MVYKNDRQLRNRAEGTAGRGADQGGFKAADVSAAGLYGHPAAHAGNRQRADPPHRSPQQGQGNQEGQGGHLFHRRGIVHHSDRNGTAGGNGWNPPEPTEVYDFRVK